MSNAIWLCITTTKRRAHAHRRAPIHLPERWQMNRFIRQICNKSFQRMTHLRRCNIILTCLSEFISQGCNNKFLLLAILRRHTRIHTSERQFICKIFHMWGRSAKSEVFIITSWFIRVKVNLFAYNYSCFSNLCYNVLNLCRLYQCRWSIKINWCPETVPMTNVKYYNYYILFKIFR